MKNSQNNTITGELNTFAQRNGISHQKIFSDLLDYIIAGFDPEKEYTALMEYIAVHSESFYLVMYTLSHTGARVSELLQFKIDDILNGDVVLSGKGGKYRRFFFTKENIRLAKEFREKNSGIVMLCNNKYGETLSSRGLSLKIKYYGEKAGVRKEICHPHAFRHYFAKAYLKRSKDVVQLAEILGHSSIDTTRIYLHTV